MKRFRLLLTGLGLSGLCWYLLTCCTHVQPLYYAAIALSPACAACLAGGIPRAFLPPRLQGPADRAQQDERNTAIRGRAAWTTFNLSLYVLCGLICVYLHQADRTTSGILLAVALVQILTYGANWLWWSRKM